MLAARNEKIYLLCVILIFHEPVKHTPADRSTTRSHAFGPAVKVLLGSPLILSVFEVHFAARDSSASLHSLQPQCSATEPIFSLPIVYHSSKLFLPHLLHPSRTNIPDELRVFSLQQNKCALIILPVGQDVFEKDFHGRDPMKWLVGSSRHVYCGGGRCLVSRKNKLRGWAFWGLLCIKWMVHWLFVLIWCKVRYLLLGLC